MNANYKSLISRLNSVYIMKFICLSVQNHGHKSLIFKIFQTINNKDTETSRQTFTLTQRQKCHILFGFTLVRNISGSHNSAYLFHGLQIRRQTCETYQQKSSEIQFSPLHTSSHVLNLKYSSNKQQEPFRFFISCSVKLISVSGISLPPWQQNIFSSKIAATGRQLKQSVNVFHNFILYLLLP